MKAHKSIWEGWPDDVFWNLNIFLKFNFHWIVLYIFKFPQRLYWVACPYLRTGMYEPQQLDTSIFQSVITWTQCNAWKHSNHKKHLSTYIEFAKRQKLSVVCLVFTTGCYRTANLKHLLCSWNKKTFVRNSDLQTFITCSAQIWLIWSTSIEINHWLRINIAKSSYSKHNFNIATWIELYSRYPGVHRHQEGSLASFCETNPFYS